MESMDGRKKREFSIFRPHMFVIAGAKLVLRTQTPLCLGCCGSHDLTTALVHWIPEVHKQSCPPFPLYPLGQCWARTLSKIRRPTFFQSDTLDVTNQH